MSHLFKGGNGEMNNHEKYQYVKKCTEMTLFIARLKKQLQIGLPGNEQNAAYGIDLLHNFMNGEFVDRAADFLWKNRGKK